MNIKIMSDSTCDLPQALVEHYDIGIVPMIVIKGGEEFLDGDITPEDIFAHVAAGGDLCSTAARNMGVFHDAFARYADSYDAVIFVSLGSGFSSSYQNAVLASQEFDNVYVVDSTLLCCAEGLVVLKACELAKTASSVEALIRELDIYKGKMDASFVVEKLDYLVKGGRCSAVAALGANLLNLKPCIELRENYLGVGKKYRGNFAKCLQAYVKDRLADREDIDTSALMFIYTSAIPQETLDMLRQTINEYIQFDVIHEAIAGCTISSHCGPGAFSIMFARK